MWRSNQQITRMDDDKIRLTFSAVSRVELIPWILSFGEEAKVVNRTG
ncbi:MAG: WYL domain-containing protein [Desulfatirhabdiaceae bacterium]